MRLRGRLAALAAAVLAGALCAGSAAADAPRPGLIPIKVSVIAPGTSYAQFSIAQEHGLFAKNGLDVTLITIDQASAGLAALAAGQTQFAFTGPNLVDAAASGLPVEAIFAINNVSIAQVCTLDAIRTPQDLIGKTVALPHRGTAPDITFRMWLAGHGIADSQLTIRNLDAGNPAVMAAAAAGAVQGFALNPPRCYLNAQHGFHVLANLADGGTRYFNAGVATTHAYLAGHRDVAERFVRSLIEAEALFRTDRAVAFHAASELDEVNDPRVAQQVWDFYKRYWANPPAVDPGGLLEAIRASASEKTRQAGPSMVGQMYDNSVVEAALKGPSAR